MSASRTKSKLGLVIAIVVLGVLATTAYFVVPLVMETFQQERLRSEGRPAPAKILAVRETRTRVNHHWVFELELEVYPEGGEPYRTTVAQPFSMLHARNLHAGGAAEVRYDQADPLQVVVMSTGGALPPAARGAGAPAADAGDPSAPSASCQRAARCCRLVVPEDEQGTCEALETPTMTEQSCQAALAGYEIAVQQKGMTCD